MILLDRYELVRAHGEHAISVGFGSYGQVKLAVDMKTGNNVAVKIVHKLAKNEVIYHKQLFHPNVIKMLDYLIDKEKEMTYMILEYADGGTLFEKIRHQKITKPQIKSYFRDVCEGIAYLHGKQIMHRDIKPENILLTTSGRAKLCDFGFAAVLEERKTLCGTYEYMSPEMVQNKPYDYKIDIWALGILLFELISGRAPFKGNSPEEVLDQMKTKIFFNQRFIPEEIDLIKSILRVTPSKRPTIKDILDHPYLSMEDTVSTKESEIEIKELKQAKSEANPKFFMSNQQVQTPKMGEKNSFPFYIPKSKAQVQTKETTSVIPQFGDKSPVKNGQKPGLNTSFGPMHRNQIMMQTGESQNQVGFHKSPTNHQNSSFSNPSYPYIRYS